jgi:hypothetical protein
MGFSIANPKAIGDGAAATALGRVLASGDEQRSREVVGEESLERDAKLLG